jgi:hypothetical protein
LFVARIDETPTHESRNAVDAASLGRDSVPHIVGGFGADVVMGRSWQSTGAPLGVDMLYRTRNKYPWLEMQTIYPFTEEGIGRAVADAMAMKTVKSTIVPWPELVE